MRPGNVAVAEHLRMLAKRLARLAPSRRDPEQYFVEKDEIIAALKLLSVRLSKGQGNG